MSQSTPASAYQPTSNGVPLSVEPEQYGLQGPPSLMNGLGPTAASQTWPQSLHSFAGYNSRQLGQSSAADHASSLSSLFDQLSVGQASAHGNFQQLTSLSNSQVGKACGFKALEHTGFPTILQAEAQQMSLQMLFPREFDRGLPQAQSLSQSAPGSLQAQLSSLGLSSGPWSSQLSSTVSSQANSSLTSLQLHQQRNGHRPVCRCVLRLGYLQNALVHSLSSAPADCIPSLQVLVLGPLPVRASLPFCSSSKLRRPPTCRLKRPSLPVLPERYMQVWLRLSLQAHSGLACEQLWHSSCPEQRLSPRRAQPAVGTPEPGNQTQLNAQTMLFSKCSGACRHLLYSFGGVLRPELYWIFSGRSDLLASSHTPEYHVLAKSFQTLWCL